MENNFDFIIIGSGLAGLTTALALENSGTIAIFTKKKPSDSSTNLAQGGMAAMVGQGDRINWHIEDTLKAGDFHNNRKAVSLLVNNSREALIWLKTQGVRFDTRPSLEAGHRLPRIFHTSDFTGQDIEKTLLKNIKKNKNIKLFKNSLALDLIVKKNICFGTTILTEKNVLTSFFAKAVILATGGSGQVFQWTTNPKVATGDGLAIGLRAGVKVSGLEFVQFHPTAFKSKESPLFLLSERLRGEGAKLVDKNGNRFVDELIPRDELSRAVYDKQKTSEVYLTMAHLNKKEIIKKLPNIYKRLKEYGYDLTVDRVPITPAAHYQCGGIVTDLNGRTSIKNLFAVGEVAATGVHGANRLASNSLLEAVVFGKQVGKYINKNQKSILRQCFLLRQNFEGQVGGQVTIINQGHEITFSKKDRERIDKIEQGIKKIMWEKVGIVRKREQLIAALYFLNSQKIILETIIKKLNLDFLNNQNINKKIITTKYRNVIEKIVQTSNLIEVAKEITKESLARHKSLGAHHIH